MKLVNVKYPVILTPSEDSCEAYIPGFDTTTKGEDLEDALEMALASIEMEAMFMYDDHSSLPAPVGDESIFLKEGQVLEHVVAEVPEEDY
ncbi:MAG: type II toxin-antitoxin system HicB family antitoxin [Anaerovoracaceae bacterium]